MNPISARLANANCEIPQDVYDRWVPRWQDTGSCDFKHRRFSSPVLIEEAANWILDNMVTDKDRAYRGTLARDMVPEVQN